jgi:NAD(P) transhydrogenase
MSEHYDLVVIGARPGGRKGRGAGCVFWQTRLYHRARPKTGRCGDQHGTVPSKAARDRALFLRGLRQRGLYGVDYHVKQDITIGDFMFRERLVVDAEWKLIDENIRKHQIAQVQGTAKFVDAHTLDVARYGEPARHITADVFLIATGSQPLPPDGVTVDGRVIVDSDTLLTLEHIPASMIVVGGGVIGCEYACIFAALGVRVTILTSRTRLLGQLDPDVSDAPPQMTGGSACIAPRYGSRETHRRARPRCRDPRRRR